MSLAGDYSGSVVLGLNRGYNNLTNTIAAAQAAVDEIGNLLVIKLGNEPEYYSLRAVASNVSRLYFHHSTVGNCQYCFWGVYDVGAPYYGATAATAALAGASNIAPLNNGTTNYTAYATYDLSGNPLRVLLYNSDYFNGTGTRSSQTFELTGLNANSVQAKRLTAANALSRVDQGSPPTWGGQEYTNGNCVVSGTETFETATVTAGAATFTLQAAEALLVTLQ
ncbi:hypothetical protein SEUCBS140593_010324 [Sporothrix eucalyptigena]|uniref:Beta-glucuronidase C-terminal domain-containing protein n=1 Tax=Sporothrix eucalyptigena TaxID=1812306 RepID=A0ABP0D2N0_9PEZI